jgi:hypothetical protein
MSTKSSSNSALELVFIGVVVVVIGWLATILFEFLVNHWAIVGLAILILGGFAIFYLYKPTQGNG